MKKYLSEICIFLLLICFSACQSKTGYTLASNNKDTCRSLGFKDGYQNQKGDLRSVTYGGDGDTYKRLETILKNFDDKKHLTGKRFKVFKKNVINTAKAKRTKDVNLMWYVITYISEYPDGQLIEEDALLLLPYTTATTGTFPLVEINHGTIIGKTTGTTSNNSNYSEWWAAWELASTGVAVLLPNYPGYGLTSENIFHPYMCKKSLAASSRDALNATIQFFKFNKDETLGGKIYDNALDFNGDVSIAGYSEGGFVTLALLEELQNNPVEGINLKLVLPMAAPSDVSETMVNCFKSDEKYAHPFYLPYCFLGWRSIDSELFNENRVFSEEMKNEILPLFLNKTEQNELEEKIESVLGDKPCYTLLSEKARSWIFDPEKSESGKLFTKILKENDVIDVNVPHGVKVKILHSPTDDCVPYENSVKLFERMKTKTQDVELITLPNDTHAWAFPDAWGYAYKIIMEEFF